MSCVIDLHSHILPGIDDGSTCVEESISMLRMEMGQGVTHVVATPHFYADCDTPEEFLDRRDRAEEKLRRALAEHPELPEIVTGAEVHYFRGISDSKALRKLTIRGTSAVMIEMPEAPWSEIEWQELEGIYRQLGVVPIIAHVDRYIGPLRTYGIPKRLAQLPVLVQANAAFFLKRSTARMAAKLLQQDRIHFLGSDCHNLTSRLPNLGDAREVIRRRSGESALKRIDSYGADLLQLTDNSFV